MSATNKELTRAEEQVMQAIWQIEKGFAKSIHEALREPRPAYNTVLTVIRILCEKGFVSYITYGKSNEYYPLITKQAYSSRQMSSLKQRYFNGSGKAFLSFFLKDNPMDLNELEQLLNELKNEEND